MQVTCASRERELSAARWGPRDARSPGSWRPVGQEYCALSHTDITNTAKDCVYLPYDSVAPGSFRTVAKWKCLGALSPDLMVQIAIKLFALIVRLFALCSRKGAFFSPHRDGETHRKERCSLFGSRMEKWCSFSSGDTGHWLMVEAHLFISTETCLLKEMETHFLFSATTNHSPVIFSLPYFSRVRALVQMFSGLKKILSLKNRSSCFLNEILSAQISHLDLIF